MNIKQEYKKNGYNFTLLKAEQLTDKRIKAIYHQHKEGESYAYEVQIVRLLKRFTGITWANPANEDFGTNGWTYVNKTLAESKFNDIMANVSTN